MRGATKIISVSLIMCRFQSTRPVWGATYLDLRDYAIELISIHAPRAGRDFYIR